MGALIEKALEQAGLPRPNHQDRLHAWELVVLSAPLSWQVLCAQITRTMHCGYPSLFFCLEMQPLKVTEKIVST
jgi:hypothetical protein